jgi:transposase, IS5 family
VLRETDPQTTLWDALLPEEAKRLPAELQAVDAYLDDERFIAPWRALFDRRLGRPSVPIDTLLRLLYLKHRYGLGDESLCREVADSIGWRRFCRIPLDRPVPHPTTLVKLVGRAGPEVIGQLNQALLAKLAAGKLLCGRKLRVDTTVVEADIDYPTDADLLEHAVRKLGGLVADQGAWRGDQDPVSGSWPGGRAAGRRMRQLAQTLRRRTGLAMGEVDRLTGEVAQIAAKTLREVEAVGGNARRALARRPTDGRLRRLDDELDQTIQTTERLLAQTAQRLAGNRTIPDRVVSLCDRMPARSARASPEVRPSSATSCWSPRTSAALSPTTGSSRATRRTHPSWSPRSRGWWPSPAALPARWQATGVRDRRQRPCPGGAGVTRIGLQRTGTPGKAGWRWSGPGRFGGCGTGGLGSRPGSVTSSAALGCGARGFAACRVLVPGSGLGSSPTTCSG